MSLHNHITPQEYLKHFATNQCRDRIWRYDKEKGTWGLLPIKSAGQRKDFYPQAEEDRLTKIEQSALVPLDQLRERSQLNDDGRDAVGEYLAATIARTESIRLKMANYLAAGIADEKSDSEETARRWNVPVALVLEHLDTIEEGLEGDPFRTQEPLLHRVLELPEVLRYIVQMNWRVFTTDSPERFLTCDNPVFVGQANGLMPPDGEFLFPIASRSALVGSWRGPERSVAFHEATSRIIKEFNRYVVSSAVRWLYGHQKVDWVRKVVKNPKTSIGRAPW